MSFYGRYVDSLLGAYKQFSTKISYGGLEKEVHHAGLNAFKISLPHSAN